MRGTEPPPEEFARYFEFKIPLEPSQENIVAGKKLSHKDTRPIPCEICHGCKVDGFGAIFQQLKPYPGYFTSYPDIGGYQTMRDVSDG